MAYTPTIDSGSYSRDTIRSATKTNPRSFPGIRGPSGFITPTGTGVPTSFINQYNLDTANDLAAIKRQYDAIGSGSGAGTAAARDAINDRLQFGLRGIGLDREQLALDRRDAVEAAINNALQRGIYNSGIRIRNVNRANERADLQGKRIQLSEDELRNSIKNSLRALNAQSSAAASARRVQIAIEQERIEQQRRQQLAEIILEYGGTYSDASIPIVRPGGPQ